MSTAILPAPPPTDALRRKTFTRDEVERMENIGIFEGQRVELIEGELIDKMGQNPPHAQGLRNVMAWLMDLFGHRRILVQQPIEAASKDRHSSIPEPDLAVIGEQLKEYGKRHPRGDELVLIVEIADASLHQDLTKKRLLYARAGVPEYWVLDLPSRRLIVHRNPAGGDYHDTQILAETESVSCTARPDDLVLVRDLLP